MDFIEIYPNALPEAFCDQLINAFDSHPGVLAGSTGGGVDTDKKHSRDLMLDSHDDLSHLKNRLLGYTLAHAAKYFDKYSMALWGRYLLALRMIKATQSR